MRCSVDTKQPFGATLARSYLLDALNRRRRQERRPFPFRRPARTAALRTRRVLTFERADHIIASLDHQLQLISL
jgi:hypothetical protein